MIDILLDENKRLNDIQQIGRPESNNKIYIESSAYERMHAKEYQDKSVFVLMGHTRRQEENYATFIDGIIPVREIAFDGNIPIWNNHVWNDVFGEIKHNYENEVIVGWAMDIKGFTPRLTVELENIHREQFGGAHQMLLLMDSLEQEEYFYQMRNNHLVQRDGFYIYYNDRPKIINISEFMQEDKGTKADVSVEIENAKPRYRELLANGKKEEPKEKISGIAVAVAVLLLVGIIGTGIYQNRIQFPGIEHIIETFFETGAPQAGVPEILLPR